jgi:hypothetical protein
MMDPFEKGGIKNKQLFGIRAGDYSGTPALVETVSVFVRVRVDT